MSSLTEYSWLRNLGWEILAERSFEDPLEVSGSSWRSLEAAQGLQKLQDPKSLALSKSMFEVVTWRLAAVWRTRVLP